MIDPSFLPTTMSKAPSKHRGVPVRISDSLYAAAKAHAACEFRTITGQLEYWARLGQHLSEHPGASAAEVLRQVSQPPAPEAGVTDSPSPADPA